MTLDIARSLLDYDREGMPAFVKSERWQYDKLYNTYLGAWVNLHLGSDVLVSVDASSERGQPRPQPHSLRAAAL